jgi:nucleoside-diphosphate-sugar epimerase
MKILLTGASGFIGSHLIPLLEKNNHTVYSLKNDLLDFDSVSHEVLSENPDIIIHLAARTEVEKSFYEQISFSQVNYIGSINLIEAANKLKNLKNFIFASTMEVYGWQPISDEIKNNNNLTNSVAFDENTTPNPNAPYAVAKYAVEKYLQYMHRSFNFPFTAIRQTNSYGRKDNNFFVTEQIISQMLQNDKEIFLGYANPYRNFIYIDDLLDAWIACIENSNLINDAKIVTIGPDRPIKIKDYANTIAQILGWNGQIHWDSKPERPGEIYWLNSNHNLITKLTGWKPIVNIEDGLCKTINHWKEKLNKE